MDLREINFGVEIETVKRTRERVARAIYSVVGGEVRHVGSPASFDPWEITDEQGRTWKVVADGSLINVPGHLRAEVVSPVLAYEDIPILQEVIRAVRRSGAKVDEKCGIHVHVDATAFDGRTLGNLAKIIYKQGALNILVCRCNERATLIYLALVNELNPRRKNMAQEYESNSEAPEEDVEDFAEKEDDESSTTVRYSISSYGADYPVDGLVKRMEKGDIQIPEFQRKFVWTHAQCSRFIESLLLGLPVPGIFLSKEPETQKLFVIDGQQRLMTLKCFYDGIINEREFKLNGVNSEFEGLTYKTLKDEDRRRLDDSIIHATIVRQEEPEEDQSSIYLVFERLNTGGTPLSSQEIRACIYHGPFNDLLRELNNNPSWRKIYGKESKRAKDQELILRFFALLYNIDSYKRPMKLFLSEFMAEYRYLKSQERENFKNIFESTVQLASNLEPSVFRPERALNVSVLESILIGTAKRLGQGEISDIPAYKQTAQDLVKDKDFLTKCKVGTTDVENVRGRIAASIDSFKNVQ